MSQLILKWFGKNALYLAWLQAVLAATGSLYFSEIAGFTPCVLCWWQRMLIYALTLILTVSILIKDRWAHYYVLPFSVLGMGIAAYQNALTYGWLTENLTSCTVGVSCTLRYINYFGFVTIPLLSLLAFAIITTCVIWADRNRQP